MKTETLDTNEQELNFATYRRASSIFVENCGIHDISSGVYTEP